MDEFKELALQALKELGADTQYTRGAILRHRMEQIALQRGIDLQDIMDTTGLKFGQMINDMVNVHAIRPPDTDMFVGIEGAQMPPEFTSSRSGRRLIDRSTDSDWIRGDAYEAFTRISNQTYYYVKSQDRFTKEISDEHPSDLVEIPSPNLEQLTAQRLLFSEIQDGEVKAELISAIKNSSNPLWQFRYVIQGRHLRSSWHTFQAGIIKELVEMWAKENNLALVSAWFNLDELVVAPSKPQDLLSRFAQYMTEDEVRSISVPFRAVEALYLDLSKIISENGD